MSLSGPLASLHLSIVASSIACGLGCAVSSQHAEGDEARDVTDDAVVVDTSSPQARAQYDADVAFASKYLARCKSPKPALGHPRVLVTGFGRFLENETNATGMMVSKVVPGGRYPLTHAPAPGAVDPPEPQTAVVNATITLPKSGAVDVCAIVLPVYWDVAAILTIKEIDAFAPSFVLMNGIAGTEQPLWLELGAVNRAMSLEDGSGALVAVAKPGASVAPLVPSATSTEQKIGLMLSWTAVETAAQQAIAAHGADPEGGRAFSSIVLGAELGGFPREGNTYLCNNLSYVVDYAMGHPGRTLTLLQASRPLASKINKVTVRLAKDLRAVPRVFVHWPSTLSGKHLDAGAEVMRAIVDAQLDAIKHGDRPTVGNNARAEILPTGDTF